MIALRPFFAAFLIFFAGPALAGETLVYQDDAVILEGYLARAEGVSSDAPVVLIVHQWKGPGAYERSRADLLAAQGYHAFVIDMYGQGIRPQAPADSGAEAGKYKNDPALARQRLNAALDFIKTQPGIDSTKIAIIGYCFGGTMALELARSGADLRAAISFHGGLASKEPVREPGIIKAAIQIHHGAIDPHVPEEEVRGFTGEMTAAKADWVLTMYGDAVHSFTEKAAGNDPSKGSAYHEKADLRSWAASLDFLKEAFAQ